MGTNIVPFQRRGVVGRRRKLISPSAASAIRTRVGPAVNAGLIHHIYEVTTPGGVLVVTIVDDDSGSARKYRPAKVTGINKAVALMKEQISADVGATLTMKAMRAETPWMVGLPLDLVELPLDLPYKDQGRTPRFRGTLEALGLSLAMVAEIGSRGLPARAVTLIVTDDEPDNESWPTTANDVALVVRDMRRHGHITRGLGVGNPIGYRAIFASMGLLDGDVDDCEGDFQITEAFQHFAAIANRSRLALTSGP